jgi:hypothetical protein
MIRIQDKLDLRYIKNYATRKNAEMAVTNVYHGEGRDHITFSLHIFEQDGRFVPRHL